MTIPPESPRPTRSFARGLIGLWLSAAIILAAGLYLATRLPENHRYRECQKLFGWDEECRSRIARERALAPGPGSRERVGTRDK